MEKRFGEREPFMRHPGGSADRRRYLALRAITGDLLGKVRYLNQVAIAMRAGMLDLEGAAQEIDLTERQLHELVRRMRDAAGLDDAGA